MAKKPGYYEMEIVQGSTFSLAMNYKDSNDNIIDLSTYTARMKIKKNRAQSTSILELTTENGRITVGSASPNIVLFISDTDTAALDFQDAVYDLEITDGTQVFAIMNGPVSLLTEVTN